MVHFPTPRPPILGPESVAAIMIVAVLFLLAVLAFYAYVR